MCEGSFLPSSFGPHQKHTEFESSLRSYPINPFALFAKGWGLFSRSRRESAFTHLSSEERRDESLLSNTCHSESALAVRNLLFAGVPLDKSEGVVKTEISWAVREHRFFGRAVREHPNIVEIRKRTKQSLFFT